MISYTNSTVVQYLRQYEMFANSLKLIKKSDERDMVIKQLTKLESKIIEATNENYEDEYYILANKECGLLEDEKKRVSMLIDLINQRLSYIEKRCNDHYQLTGESIDIKDVLGANTLDNLEKRLRIIDKYSKNIKLQEELKKDIKTLNSKIDLASEKIDINKSLNIELETKFKSILSNAFEENNLYDLLDIKDEIKYAYYETEKSLTLAELNLENAKTSPLNLLDECLDMLKQVNIDYIKYKDKISLLKLMEIFNQEVNTYDELLKKRREVNEVFKSIKNENFLKMVSDTVSKQYNTILMEQQDINTLNDLTLEKDRKLEALAEIQEENESEEFQNILKVLIENERKKQEKLEEERRKKEAEEKKKKIELEKRKQEEILKRQKIIEEARKKEIERRTKELLEQQQNSVLQTRKKENDLSFETIKDNIENNNIENIESKETKSFENDFKLELDIDKIDDDINPIDDKKQKQEENLFKEKIDIEKELFDEFNSLPQEENLFDNQVVNNEINLSKNNKLPEISIDEYMKKFKEETIKEENDFFGSNDIFPSIPL